ALGAGRGQSTRWMFSAARQRPIREGNGPLDDLRLDKLVEWNAVFWKGFRCRPFRRRTRLWFASGLEPIFNRNVHGSRGGADVGWTSDPVFWSSRHSWRSWSSRRWRHFW